ERFRLNTQRVIAAYLGQHALSNVWWPLKLYDENEDWEKALVLWLNSTLGLINVIAQRTPTEGPWIQFKKPILEALTVINPRALTPQQLARLVRAFDEVSVNELLPLPQLATDAERIKIDAAFEEVFGIRSLAPLRELLSREPIVANTRLG